MSELINSYIDLAAIRKETDLFLEQIETLKKAKDELSKTKATLKVAVNNKEILDATNATAKAFDAATKAQDNFAKNVSKNDAVQKTSAKSTKEATAETEKLIGAYDRLKAQFKEADVEAKNLAAEFGVNSEQAIKAAESAAAYKQQLKEIDDLSKGKQTKTTAPEEIPFTHNLNPDGSVIEGELSGATTAVNELNAAEAELTNTATAMGNSNLKAAEEIKTTTASAEHASTALQELNGTIAQNVKIYNDYQAELKAVKAEQKAIEASIKEAGAASEEDIRRKIQLGIRERELKIASSELNQTINAQTKELQAAEGSYDKMNHQLGQMRDAFRQLSEEERNSAFGQELQARIQITDEAIKKLDADIGNFQRNVGNYQGSFSEPFKILQTELTQIKTKLNDPALSGKSLEALQKEEALLVKLTESLSKGFPNLTREVRALTNASNQLGAELGEDSELFQKFAAAAGEASDAQKDLQARVTFNASDTKYIDSAVEAVNGLAGAYSAAEGAAQLFGDGNEDVQRGMQKLQALIAITTGLQQVQNALQSESAAMQGLLAAKTGLLAAAMQLQNFAMGAGVVVTEAQTVATGEAAIAAEVETAALAEETVATVAATTATTSLTTAIAVGLLGAFAAVGAAIYFAFKALGNWIVGSQKTVEEQGKLLDLVKSTNDALVEQANILAQQTASQKAFYETQLALSQAAGANAYKQLAIRKQIAKEEADIAQQQVDLLGANNKEQSRLMSTIQKANNARLRASETLTNELSKDVDDQDERLIKSAQGIIQLNEKIIAANQPLLDAGNKARQDLINSRKAATLVDIEEAKLSADERRKLTLETTTLEVDLIKTKNSEILNDEKSTLTQRLDAIRSNAAAERKVIEAQKNDVVNNPSSTAIDRTIAIRRAAEEEKKVTITTNRELFTQREDYRKRELTANKTMLELEVQAEIDKNEKLRDDENLSIETRMDALNKAYQDRKVLIDAEYEYSKELNKNKNASYAEEELLEKDHEAKLSALAITTSAKVRDITLKDIEARKAGLETLRNFEIDFYNQIAAYRNVKPAEDHAEDILALNRALQSGKIGIEKYNKEREKLDHDYNVSQLENQVKQDKDLLAIAHKYGKDDHDIRKKLADDEVALADATSEKIKKIKQAEYDKKKEIANAGFDLLTTVVDAGYTREINHIQDLIDKNDEYYGKEIENIRNSTLSTQEKAERTTILEAEQAANRTQLQRKQRDEQVKQAKFDRDAQALSIIGNAIAAHFKIIAELGPLGLPLAISNDILAGIQVATLLAKPLPKFKHGKFTSYEGFAEVGDGGKQEVIVRNGGKIEITPDVPTLTWIGQKDKVYPDVNSYAASVNEKGKLIYPDAVPFKQSNIEEKKSVISEYKTIYTNNKTAENKNVSLETRLDAINASFETQKNILNKQFEYQKKEVSIEQVELLKKDYETKVTALQMLSSAKVLQLTIDEIHSRKDFDSEHKAQVIDNIKALKTVHTNHAENIINLNNSLQNERISLKEYEKEKISLDNRYYVSLIENRIAKSVLNNTLKQISTLTKELPNPKSSMWVGKNNFAFPDVKSFTSNISTRQTDRVISNSTVKIDPNGEMVIAYRQSAARLENAIKKIPATKVNFYSNGEFNEWVRINVRGKR